MSRAGKFIPGGANKSAGETPVGGGRTGPIRAPAPAGAAPEPSGGGSKRPFGKGSSLVKPVPKNRRLPIVIMSGMVCCLLVSFAWYEFAVLPAQRDAQAARQAVADAQAKAAADLAAEKQHEAELLKQQNSARATLTVDSNPTGASVIIGEFHLKTPAIFNALTPGKISVVIQADGYEDYHQDLSVTADKPTDLGTVQLVAKVGAISLSSPQSNVSYSITGPNDYSHQGQLPDKLDGLPTGDYQLTAWQEDWKLAPMTLTLHDQEKLQKEIKFPYANVAITSTPSGATIRDGRNILGRTPLTLNNVRPGDLHISVDLPPNTTQRFLLHVPENGNINKSVALQQDKDFIAACGMPMVWVPDGGFWAGKYDVRQAEFETVAGYNPSTFRRSTRPIETISWDAANAFCDKLNQFEHKAGKLPDGFHYALPTESQWETFSADADIDQAPMSRNGMTLSSTQDAGASEANKYGIYDTLGNVWEWCQDAYDDKGDHSLRGGSWLSSPENFPGPDTRNAGGPKYADRFTGFRVVLVPQ
ncbi:MAG: SUMF1/EgtB/PvdO family nonheme iron enzyme [Methylacidiphilales bacterium]|nr:SUMF1/EgtB/PvdO family nonheme iron enzyme [Candidatus Methylacidiphilales bacterium]